MILIFGMWINHIITVHHWSHYECIVESKCGADQGGTIQ